MEMTSECHPECIGALELLGAKRNLGAPDPTALLLEHGSPSSAWQKLSVNSYKNGAQSTLNFLVGLWNCCHTINFRDLWATHRELSFLQVAPYPLEFQLQSKS